MPPAQRSASGFFHKNKLQPDTRRFSCPPISVIASAVATTLSVETLTSLTFDHLYTWAGATCYSFTGVGGDGLQACQVHSRA